MFGIALLVWLLAAAPAGAQAYRWLQKVPGQGLGNPLAVNPLDARVVYGATGGNVISISRDRGRTWGAYSTLAGGGAVKCIIVSPLDTSRLVAGQEGTPSDRVMKSTDGGTTWTQTLSGEFSYFGVPIEFNAAHPDTLFTGMSGKLYRSDDFGSSWTIVNASPGFNEWCDAAYPADSSNILYVGDNTSGIWKTRDGGLSFRRVYVTTGEIPMLAVDPFRPGVVYATKWAGGGGFLRSADYGESWSLIPGFNGLDTWGVALCPSDSNLILMGTYTLSPLGGLFLSKDAGASWERIVAGLNSTLTYGVLAIDSVSIFALQGDGIFSLGVSRTAVTGTVRDGATMEPVTGGVAVVPGTRDTIRLAGSGGDFTVYSFEGLPAVLRIRAYPFEDLDAKLAYSPDSTVRHDILLTRLAQSSISGAVRDSAAGRPLAADVDLTVGTQAGPITFHAQTDSLGGFRFEGLYVSHPPIVYSYTLSVDAGVPYPLRRSPLLALGTKPLEFPFDMTASDLFLVGEDSSRFIVQFEQALDSIGVTYYPWNTVAKGTAPLERGTEFRKRSVIYFTGDKQTPISHADEEALMACLNSGANLLLTGQDILEYSGASSLFQDALQLSWGGNSGDTYVKASPPTELFSPGGFPTFDPTLNYPNSRDIIAGFNPRARQVFAYGEAGDAGTAGVRIDSVGAGSKVVLTGFGFESIVGNASRKRFLQKAVGWFDGSIVLDAPGREAPVPLPAAVALAQNYPNPFNPSTVLRYTLGSRMRARIDVYNILGQLVATPVDALLEAGEHRVVFDGRGLPSGVYTAVLTAGSRTALRGRMLLLR